MDPPMGLTGFCQIPRVYIERSNVIRSSNAASNPLWDLSGAAAICDAAAPTLFIYFCFSAPKRNRKTEGNNGSVALALDSCKLRTQAANRCSSRPFHTHASSAEPTCFLNVKRLETHYQKPRVEANITWERKDLTCWNPPDRSFFLNTCCRDTLIRIEWSGAPAKIVEFQLWPPLIMIMKTPWTSAAPRTCSHLATGFLSEKALC